MERAGFWQGKRLKRVVVSVLAAGVFIALSAEATTGWRLERDRDGIRIDSRPVEGWAIREFRGQTQVNAKLSSIVAALHDVSTGKELVDVVAESTVHDRESDTRYRVYSRMDMPFPLTDRDILNQREIRQDPQTLTVTISDIATTGVLPHKKGLIRIEKSRQQWTLTPVATGQVNVEVVNLSDPAGPIPASLINAMSVDTPFNMLARLKEIVKRDQYARAWLAFISDEAARAEPPAAGSVVEASPAPAPAAKPSVASPPPADKYEK